MSGSHRLTHPLVLALVLVLAACGVGDELGERALEEAAEQAAGGEDAQVDLDVEDDGASIDIESDQGSASLQTGEDLDLPAGFDLPLPSEYQVAQVLEQDDESGEQVTVTIGFPSDEAEDLFQQLVDHLEAGGFEVRESVVAEGMQGITADKDNQLVLVQMMWTGGDPRATAIYTLRQEG